MKLNKTCRNLTTFIILIKFLRITIFSIKIINFVIQLVRIMTKILINHIRSEKTRSFLNDKAVKDSKTKYNNEEVKSKIKRSVLKHIMWLNEMFANIEKIECIISEHKFQFCMLNLKIVNYVIDFDEKNTNITKIIKIIHWPKFKNSTKIRIFISIYGYYKIWIKRFFIIAKFIYRLLKKILYLSENRSNFSQWINWNWFLLLHRLLLFWII